MSISISSFPQTSELAQKVSHALKAKHTNIKVNKFPDGESHIRLKENPKGKTVIIINSFENNANEKIIETILAAGIARQNKAKKVILVATYLPYMRQDKEFNKYESISAHHIIKLLAQYFDNILAIDPHLHRISSLKKLSPKAREITTNKLLADYIRKHMNYDFEIVGPDMESQQWGKKIASIIGKKAVILKKSRISSTKVKIKSKKLARNVIIIDDIISTGNTILETIKIAEKQGARRITVFGIHGLLLNNSARRITRHAKLITTNTVQNKYAKIDVSPLIAKELKRYI